MKLSIAISTYEARGKGRELLERNLVKIFEQDFPISDFEVVISDHSKDDVIHDYIKGLNKKNVKYVRFPQKYGQSSANINNAIDNCTGEIIKILFMDDYLYGKDALTKTVKEFEKNPNKVWLITDFMHSHDHVKFSPCQPVYNPNVHYYNTMGCPSGLSFRNSVKERFDENLIWYMDCEFYRRMYDKYGQPIWLRSPTIVYFLHPNQVTNTLITAEVEAREKKYVIDKHGVGKK